MANKITKGFTTMAPLTASFVNYSAYDARTLTSNYATAVQSDAVRTAAQSTSGNLLHASVLKAQPTLFSSAQFDLNSTRLNKISDAAKNLLINPAIEAQPYRFGVLEQIRPEIQEYKKAYRGVSGLFTALDAMFDKAEVAYIKAEFAKIGSMKSYEEVRKAAEATVTAEATANAGVPAAGTVEFRRRVSEVEIPLLYETFYDIGKFLVGMIAYMEARYTKIESKLENKLRMRLQQEAQLQKLQQQLLVETDKLAALEGRRVEVLGDYGVAQRLLEEDWRRVYQQQLKRSRILTEGVRGLYYVRVRQTPVSMALADPLALRHGKASDIVPGCDWQKDVDLPEQLDDFFGTVLEVPMNDWASLREFIPQLPVDRRIENIARLRQVRLQGKAQFSYQSGGAAHPLQARLAMVRNQSRAVVDTLAKAALPLFRDSVKSFQQESARVLSLADLLSGTRGTVCKQAQTLRERLEQCAGCMLEQLNELPPSIRLQWAQLAEDDRLVATEVKFWPGLERAETEDFNATRTLAELVSWWFRQLDPAASSSGQGALRNMVRAIVIHAALGDPSEIVQGAVLVAPRRLAIGEALRLKLNRAPQPGTLLQLLDPQQKLVALLTIDDHDAEGTLANITRVDQQQVRITSAYRVVATKLTQQLK